MNLVFVVVLFAVYLVGQIQGDDVESAWTKYQVNLKILDFITFV